VRFSAQLGFRIESQTQAAVAQLADQIQVISNERIHYELKRLMQTPRSAQGIKLLKDLGLLKAILKEIYSEKAILNAVNLLERAEDRELEIKFSLFWQCFLKVGTSIEDLKNKLRELKFSRDELEIYFYVTDALRKIQGDVLVLGESYELVFGKHGKTVLEIGKILWKDSEDLSKLLKIEKLLNDFSQLPKALITGNDLIELGLKPSSQMKDILKRAYYYQLENKINDKPQMLNWTKKQIS
jgi:tRNA nucleotidyltransferase/poly(A) polymerase